MRTFVSICAGAFLLLAGSFSVRAAENSWARDAIFYHVYVRSYADSDGDGIGDLPGLTSKLDYIQSLGVDALLLLPIFENNYHIYGGYATTDYHHVERTYGGDSAWEEFIKQAHVRKMKVLLDLSLTHVADTHPWFVSAKRSATAPERAHFMWAGPPCPAGKGVFGAPAWYAVGEGPCYFALYAPNVPALNFRDRATADAQIEVGNYWLSRGADGFRLDSAPHIAPVDPGKPEVIESSAEIIHQFWRRFMRSMKADNAQSVAVAEVFNGDPNALTPYHADGIDMTFDFPVFFGFIDAFSTTRKHKVVNAVTRSIASRQGGGLSGLFLGNHDVPGEFIPPHGRVSDLLGGNIRRMQSAALLLFSLPGTPFIYYGDEIGMRGANPPAATGTTPDLSRKIWSRNLMKWDVTASHGFSAGSAWAPFSTDRTSVSGQDGRSDTMLETYRGLAKIRRNSPALTHGSFREIANHSDHVVSFLRTDGPQHILVAVNLSAKEISVKFDLKKSGIAAGAVTDHIFGASLPALTSQNATNYPLNLPPNQGRWLSISNAR